MAQRVCVCYVHIYIYNMFITHSHSMYAIFAYIGVVFGVNVGKYGLHGVYGTYNVYTQIRFQKRNPKQADPSGSLIQRSLTSTSLTERSEAGTCVSSLASKSATSMKRASLRQSGAEHRLELFHWSGLVDEVVYRRRCPKWLR